MHELTVTESILNIAVSHARQAGASQVIAINLVIGRLSSIINDSVQFYWDIISKDTICKGAKLHFQRIPAKLLCIQCGMEYILEGDLTPCTACGSHQVKLVSGNEFRVDSIEIEK